MRTIHVSDEHLDRAPAAADVALRLAGVTKRFDDTVVAVDHLDLTVAHGEALVLLGPSGCGKTTTLRLVAGFERPDSGEISLEGRVLAGGRRFVAPEHRGIAVVFQSYALWPHMTVDANVGFGLRVKRGVPEIDARIRAALEMVRLGGFGKRYPHQLSGGQQQRVALARALVTRPKMLLLDEPLSNLDSQLREDMRIELRGIHRELNQTMIYVTHDQSEALALADRVAVMRSGVIEQLGTPVDLYDHPRNSFVARALGPTNIVQAEVTSARDGHVVATVWGRLEVDCYPQDQVGPLDQRQVALSVRPGAFCIGGPDAPHAIPCTVAEVVYLGEFVNYVMTVDEPNASTVKVTEPGRPRFRVGDRASLSVRSGGPSLLADEISTT
jgi:ABC-type Fe3+/spermidine/putrescine transport system ATPase subunit